MIWEKNDEEQDKRTFRGSELASKVVNLGRGTRRERRICLFSVLLWVRGFCEGDLYLKT